MTCRLPVVIAIVLGLSCTRPGGAPEPRGVSPPAGASAPSTAVGPLDVAVSLATAGTSEEIGPNGGTLRVAGSDGTRFTLEIPRGALAGRTKITVTPVTGIEPFPFSKGMVGAVQLEPDGLDLAVPALLTIEPTAAVSLDERQAFSYYGTGQDFHMYPLEPSREHLRLRLVHFSGGGVGKATDADRSTQARRTPRRPEAQMWQRVAEALSKERARQLLGTDYEDSFKEGARLASETAKAAIARAVAECDGQTLLQMERMAHLIGTPAMTDAQQREFDEKCNALALSFDSHFTVRYLDRAERTLSKEHEIRAIAADARARSDGKGDLVGTALVDVTLTVRKFAGGKETCAQTFRGTLPFALRVVGGTASPSPTLVLTFRDYTNTAGCGDSETKADVPAALFIHYLMSAHEDEVSGSETDGIAWRVTDWTHVGDGPSRAWRKSYVRQVEVEQTSSDDVQPADERTTIELRRTQAK